MIQYQYFEDKIETENRDIKHRAIFPSKSTFKGRRWANWDKQDRERTMDSHNGRLVITHDDADGLTSGALFLDYFDDIEVITIDYENIEHTFEYLSKNVESLEELYVSDLNLDEVYDEIGEVEDNTSKFVWIDHHEWGENKEKIWQMGVDVRINQDRAAAGLVYEYLCDRGYEPTETVEETVELTEDHDLWNHDLEDITLGTKQICISKAFSQLAFFSETEKFLDNILDYGMEFMYHEDELLRDGMGDGFIAQKEAESDMKIEYILTNETDVKDIGDYRVAFSHGRASPGDLLEEVSNRFDADILVLTKPQYPVKASIRSTDNFKSCHKIAERLGGGGHEQSAAFKPDSIAREPLEFFEYIINTGDELQEAVEEEIGEYLAEFESSMKENGIANTAEPTN